MQNHVTFFSTFAVFAMAAMLSSVASAEIYKYQDAQGNWHFTDRPPKDQASSKIQTKGSAKESLGTDLFAYLQEKFPTETAIEAATLATVTVETPMGSGSGFFITERGHLITNKHVVQFDEEQGDEIQANIEDKEREIESLRRQINLEQSRIRNRTEALADYQRDINTLPDSAQKRREQKHHDYLMEQYRIDKKELARARSILKKGEKEFRDAKRNFEWQRTMASVARNFTIILKDGTELNARLLETSKTHDLALLKLDNYQTPALQTAKRNDAAQGMRVFAIGSPIEQRDSVSEGIISGFDDKFIKTDAAIYPGNSGGPLVLDDGRVIGINTMKRITHKFEGLGYAIGIDTAMQAFGRRLSR